MQLENEFSKILAEATMKIECGYFKLNIAGGPPVYRERVYCYELYHQMRLIWPDSCRFVLNGEVDKTAHPILETLGASRYKPDLLIHTPGDMSGNHTIIEVKRADVAWAGIRKDLKVLRLFRDKVGYQRAIFLLFGRLDRDSLLKRLRRIAKASSSCGKIEVWMHQTVGGSAEYVETI